MELEQDEDKNKMLDKLKNARGELTKGSKNIFEVGVVTSCH
jgi:hypothetical protein